jgi:hypothetical protein
MPFPSSKTTELRAIIRRRILPSPWTRTVSYCAGIVLAFTYLFHTIHSRMIPPEPVYPMRDPDLPPESHTPPKHRPLPVEKPKPFSWASIPHKFPSPSLLWLTSPDLKRIPKIQATFPRDTPEQWHLRSDMRFAVKLAFNHSWTGYRERAWLRDEVAPLSGKGLDPFGGWAATLVDSLGK